MARSENSKPTKELILDAAFSFLEQPRYTSFSMNELAAKVGITKPAIYRHFKSKEVLLDAMENRIVDDMAYLLKDIATKDLETSKKSLAGLIKYFIENPSHINYYIAQMSQNANYEEHLFKKLTERQVSFLGQVADKDSYLSAFRSDMRLFAKHIFSGMSLFYFVKLQEKLRQEGKCVPSPQEYAEKVVNLLVYGLLECTDESSPVHPQEISPERRQEIISLCKIPENSFPAENKIFKALASVIEKHKMKGVTVERIADELGMAKSSLYEYFDNKNHMIKSLVNKEISLLQTIANENTAEAGNFTEYLLIQMYSELEYFSHRPEIIPICGWLLMSANDSFDGMQNQDMEDCDEVNNVWEKRLPSLINSPDLGYSYSPRVITTWAGVLPVAFLVESKGKNLSEKKFMEGFNFMIDYIFNGIKSPLEELQGNIKKLEA